MNELAEAGSFVHSIMNIILTKLVIAIIILLAGFVIGKVLGKIVHKVLKEIEIDLLLQKTTGANLSFAEISGKFITYLVYFIFIIIALDRLGIQTFVFSLIAGGIIVIIVISLILGIKDFVPNFIAGLFLHKKGHLSEGDRIKVNDIEGTIIQINLVETRIKNKSGDILFVPNSVLTKNKVIKLKK